MREGEGRYGGGSRYPNRMKMHWNRPLSEGKMSRNHEIHLQKQIRVQRIPLFFAQWGREGADTWAKKELDLFVLIYILWLVGFLSSWLCLSAFSAFNMFVITQQTWIKFLGRLNRQLNHVGAVLKFIAVSFRCASGDLIWVELSFNIKTSTTLETTRF